MNYGGDEHPVCPMLGFPDEQIVRTDSYPYYVCRPIPHQPGTVVAVWWSDFSPPASFFVRAYKGAVFNTKDGITAWDKRYSDQDRRVDGPLHAQAVIFDFIQTHLPREVTDNAA